MAQFALDKLRSTLAGLSALQEFVRINNAREAALKIHNDVLPGPAAAAYTKEELLALRPCVLVSADRTRYRRIAAGNSWNIDGGILIELHRQTPDEPNGLKDKTFRKIGEAIVSELQDVSYVAGNLTIQELETSGPFRTEPDETAGQGDFQVYQIMMRWGDV